MGVVTRCARRSSRRSAAAIAMPLIARLLASVPPLVKTMSPARSPSIRATRARASDSASAAASPTVWWLDGLPYQRVRYGIIASSTSGRTGVVAALSRYSMLIGCSRGGSVGVDAHVEPEIEGARRMGERADRDHVDAGLGDRAHRLERHPAGGLDGRSAGHLGDARAEVVEGEVVE